MLTVAQIFRRVLAATVVLVGANLLGGCAAWNADRWDVDALRDERAVDIDQRLTRDRPIVPNPFH